MQASMNRSDRSDKRPSAPTGANLAAGAGHRSRRHTGSGSTGCNTSASASTSKSASGAKPGKGKAGGASQTAKELVASFKAISYSKLPPPPHSPPPQQENDDAFTLIDCMSVILGGGDCDRSDDKQRWRETKAQINLEAALNTVSSVCGEDESRRRQRRRRHQHRCHHHGQHHSHHHRSSHQRSPHCSGRGKQQGRRHQCSHRTPRRRRYFQSSECVATDPSAVHEATPTAPPLLDRALISVQREGASASDAWCRLFRCADCPQSLWALATRRLPALASPSPAVSPTRSSTTSQLPWPQPQSQARRRQPQNCGGGGGVWSRRGASSNCNAEGDLLAHRRPVRRRSIRRRRQSGGEDTADESSVYISASVASPGLADSARRQRHLLTPPMRPCHRVRVPAGASAGQPPPRQPRLPPRTPPPHRPDANNNRRPEITGDSADFGTLLRTLEKAQLCPRRQQPHWHTASSIELLVDRAADSEAELSDPSRSPASAGSGASKSGASSAAAPSCNSVSSGASSAGQLTVPHAKSAPPVPSGPSQRLRRQHRLSPPPPAPKKPPLTSRRGKIELISALAHSLLGLSDDLQDCISPIQGLQAQLRRANRMPRDAEVRKGPMRGRNILE